MEKHQLSKSTFIRGNQCLKSLYLYKNHIEWRDKLSDEKKALFSRGNSVGILAQQLFQPGVDASPKKYRDYSEAVLNTQGLIEEGQTNIYEAAFRYNGVLILLDILAKIDHEWFAFEVKSSAKITPTYILDAALQYYVISNSGISLKDISLVTVNTDYVKGDRLELRKFFNIKSVLTDVLKKQEEVSQQIAAQKRTLDAPSIPAISIGEHCFSPYSCDFMGQCWKHVPTYSVFDIGGMHKKEMFDLYEKGIVRIEDIPNEYVLPSKQHIQVESIKNNTAFVDAPSIKAFLESVSYPLYFIDFESFMPAIPIYPNSKPYQAIPFQYSIHLKTTQPVEAVHLEFLAEAGSDPRNEFMVHFLKHTEAPGDILAYNAAFERGILAGLKKDFPSFSEQLDNRISRIKDLMTPFEKKFFYTKEMKGSHSIKAVLPSMVKEFSYENLVIGNGTVAMNAFEKLQTDTDIFNIAETRDALLAYCKMDTLAMVKIFEELEKL